MPRTGASGSGLRDFQWMKAGDAWVGVGAVR